MLALSFGGRGWMIMLSSISKWSGILILGKFISRSLGSINLPVRAAAAATVGLVR